MGPFWFWKPALYRNYNETLQRTHPILRKMTFVSLPTKVKSWPVQQSRDARLIVSAHPRRTGTSEQHWEYAAEAGGWGCLAWQKPSQHSPCHGCSPPGPLRIPSAGSRSCSSPNLRWSLQSKGAPSSDGLSASLHNHGSVSLPAVYFSKMHLCQPDWVSFPAG